MTQIDANTISFATWCRNHEDSHNARWCRELYPWHVLAQVNFLPCQIGALQEIEFLGTDYIAEVEKQWVADNGRTNVRVALHTRFESKSQKWVRRGWNDTFQLVFGENGYFITMYTRKDDPSNQLLGDFMRGRFDRIESKRCRPLSALFFKSLISYSAEQVFGELDQYRYLPHSNFSPFLSRGCDLWISFAFTEEKAHRVAQHNFSDCQRLIVVYCHPTFSKHHRCTSADVLSLPEFLELSSAETRRNFHPQVRFLINHLHRETAEMSTLASNQLKTIILSSEDRTDSFTTSMLREAKTGLETCVETAADAACFFASANLLNAALNERLGAYEGTQQLRKEVYSFKSRVGEVFEQLVKYPIGGVTCYFDDQGAIFAEIDGIQISFHAIPLTGVLHEFKASSENRSRPWSGIRLQRRAPLLFAWASALVREELQRSNRQVVES